MNLARVIHQALTNPSYRLALETGTLDFEGVQLTPHELAAVTEVLRDNPYSLSSPSGGLFGKLFNTVCAWTDDD